MIRVLQEGRRVGAGAGAYYELKAVGGPLTVGKCVTLVRNPSEDNRLGVTLPSGTGAQVVGFVAREPLDVAQVRLRQTAIPTDSDPDGTWSSVAAQDVADQEKCFYHAGGGMFGTDQVDTSSGTFLPGDWLTFQPTAGDDCGKLLKRVYNGTSQAVGRVLGYSGGWLTFQSLLP